MIHSYVPKAASSMMIRMGRARFTVLTDRMLRMEWARDSFFEDRPTLAVVNRKMPQIPFSSTTDGKQLTIKTKRFTLKYLDDRNSFSRANLKVSFTLGGRKVLWYPGKKDPSNLMGTTRTLDEVRGSAKKLGDGLISRNGWAMVDDSRSAVLADRKDADPWATPRPKPKREDLYLLVYGHDYKAALRDAAQVFGAQPLPPRFTLGYWWSRYQAYTDKQIESLVQQHDERGIPLDVMVLDMDWHLEGWTGYTWDRRYFPNPGEFLQWLKRQGLKVTLNLHPADGVGMHEQQFKKMARAMNRDSRSSDRIHFDCTDPKYMDAYFRLLHHPHEDQGVDFWWIDWQQGTKTRIGGLDPLPWLNHLHWRDMEERNPRRRPVILSRFGGVGSGRHPIGFSGDTISVWDSLRYQPHFTATAANVMFGYWSHDIGGHMPGKIDPELYTRWIQFGAFSPILRTHAAKNPLAERRVWEYPSPYSDIMARTIRLRYEMVPYIYTENRKCTETGLSLSRPLYYDHPEDQHAYNAPNQYMFGDEMLVAPVLNPVSDKDEMANLSIYLPPGEWFDTALGTMNKGGRTVRRKYLISEIPVFVRAGAAIPSQLPPMRLVEGPYRNLIVTVYPGQSGSYELYEDDGISQDYINGRCATISFSHKTDRTKRTITIYKAKGSYKGFTSKRTLEVRMPGSVPPKSVKVDGQAVGWTYRPRADSWSYDGDEATTIIRISSLDLRKRMRIEVFPRPGIAPTAALGLKGLMVRLDRIRICAGYLNSVRVLHPKERLIVESAQLGNRISHDPNCFAAEIKRIAIMLQELHTVLRAIKRTSRKKHLKAHADKARCIMATTQRWWDQQVGS